MRDNCLVIGLFFLLTRALYMGALYMGALYMGALYMGATPQSQLADAGKISENNTHNRPKMSEDV